MTLASILLRSRLGLAVAGSTLTFGVATVIILVLLSEPALAVLTLFLTLIALMSFLLQIAARQQVRQVKKALDRMHSSSKQAVRSGGLSDGIAADCPTHDLAKRNEVDQLARTISNSEKLERQVLRQIIAEVRLLRMYVERGEETSEANH